MKTNNFNERQKKMLLFLPIFIWVSALGGNALLLSVLPDNSTENLASFQMNLPESENTLPGSKKDAYDQAIQDSLNALNENSMYTSVNWTMSNSYDEVMDEDNEQAIIDSILAGQSVKTNVYSSNNTYVSSGSSKPSYQNSYKTSNSSSQTSYTAPKSNHNNTSKNEPITSTKEESSLFNQSSAKSSSMVVSPSSSTKRIKAIIFGDQKIKPGQTVSILTKEKFELNGVAIKENSTIYGLASINGSRLIITVNNIIVNGSPIAANLTIFDEFFQQGLLLDDVSEMDINIEESGEGIANDIFSRIPGGRYLNGVGGFFKKDKSAVYLIDGLPIYITSK